VCGDRPPVFVATLGREFTNIQGDSVRVPERDTLIAVADIKRAARDVWEEHVGGKWSAQREAFPSGSGRLIQRYIIFRDDQYGRYVVSMPLVAYRYLDNDCLLFVHPGTFLDTSEADPRGDFFVTEQCGRHYDIRLGKLTRLSEIQLADAIPIDGKMLAISEIMRRGLAEESR
jgi:hypothetical protein